MAIFHIARTHPSEKAEAVQPAETNPPSPTDPPSRIRRLARRLLIELGYLAFLVLVLEGALRLGGEILHLQRTLKSETPPKAEGLRILAIGESTTYGLGVKPEEAYPHRVEIQLEEETGQPVTVINVGVPGQTSTSILRSIGFQLEQYRPDIVLCLLGTNDLNEALNDLSTQIAFGVRLPEWIAHLRVYRLVCVLRDYILYRPKMEDHGAWVFFDADQKAANGGWKMNPQFLVNLEANYREILALIRTYRAEPVMLSYLKEMESLKESFEKVAREEGVLFLDLAVAEEDAPSLLTADRFHPNPAGHLLMAERIVEGLKTGSRRLVPPIPLSSEEKGE